jgi:hypothetical protein
LLNPIYRLYLFELENDFSMLKTKDFSVKYETCV